MSAGRPSKNNADYFPHYNNMRNHRKVRAIRNRFGQALGLAFWCLMLEWLIEHDGLEFEYSEIEVEMLAVELDISAAELREMVDYCIKLEILFLTESNFLYSESLNEKLAPVFEKRAKERARSKVRERRENGQFQPRQSHEPGISAAEKPQSKEKKSKEEKSKEKKDTKKRDQKPSAFDPYVYEFSFFKSKDFIDAWHLFCDHRKEKKKTLTLRAVRIIEGELNKVTEAVAIALLKKAVAQDWTGIEAKWIKESDQEEINKHALSKELNEIAGLSGVDLPKDLLEERKKRQQRYELFGSSTPHKLKSPDPFPLELSIYHKVNGFPNDLRDNVADVIKRIKDLPTNADLANYSYRVPLHRYPHKTKYFQNAFEDWKQASNVSPRNAWEKMAILCAYIEPVASQMLLDAAKDKLVMFEEIAPERLERMKQYYEPQDEEEREFKEMWYSDNELAWIEYRRRDNLLQQWRAENPGIDEDTMPDQWPEWVSTFHNEIGTVDSRKRSHLIQQEEPSDVPPPQLKW